MTIGLGNKNKIDSLRVLYPDGKSQLIQNISVNTQVALNHKDANQDFKYTRKKNDSYFEEKSHTLSSHKEDAYIDFNYEGLIYKMQSREGPALAIADVNNDGNDDVFMGGAYGQTGKLYLQNNTGKLKVSPFETEDFFEDVTAVFEDIDGDKE